MTDRQYKTAVAAALGCDILDILRTPLAQTCEQCRDDGRTPADCAAGIVAVRVSRYGHA